MERTPQQPSDAAPPRQVCRARRFVGRREEEEEGEEEEEQQQEQEQQERRQQQGGMGLRRPSGRAGARESRLPLLRSKQMNPNLKDKSFITKETSTCKECNSTFAA